MDTAILSAIQLSSFLCQKTEANLPQLVKRSRLKQLALQHFLFSVLLVPPSFTDPYYSGTYTITENEDELTTDEITISADYNNYESITVELQGGTSTSCT